MTTYCTTRWMATAATLAVLSIGFVSQAKAEGPHKGHRAAHVAGRLGGESVHGVEAAPLPVDRGGAGHGVVFAGNHHGHRHNAFHNGGYRGSRRGFVSPYYGYGYNYGNYPRYGVAAPSVGWPTLPAPFSYDSFYPGIGF